MAGNACYAMLMYPQAIAAQIHSAIIESLRTVMALQKKTIFKRFVFLVTSRKDKPVNNANCLLA